jgi:hypothetical protein
LGRLRLADAATPALLATLRLVAGRLPAFERTVGVFDLASSLRLRSGLSSSLALLFALFFSWAFGEFEQIFVLDRVVFFLLGIQQRPKITDDPGALLDPLGSEEA